MRDSLTMQVFIHHTVQWNRDITPNMATNADQNVQPIMICEDVGSPEDPLIHYW